MRAQGFIVCRPTVPLFDVDVAAGREARVLYSVDTVSDMAVHCLTLEF